MRLVRQRHRLPPKTDPTRQASIKRRKAREEFKRRAAAQTYAAVRFYADKAWPPAIREGAEAIRNAAPPGVARWLEAVTDKTLEYWPGLPAAGYYAMWQKLLWAEGQLLKHNVTPALVGSVAKMIEGLAGAQRRAEHAGEKNRFLRTSVDWQDYRQNAYLYASEAVPKWDPNHPSGAPLASFLYQGAKYAVTDAQRALGVGDKEATQFPVRLDADRDSGVVGDAMDAKVAAGLADVVLGDFIASTPAPRGSEFATPSRIAFTLGTLPGTARGLAGELTDDGRLLRWEEYFGTLYRSKRAFERGRAELVRAINAELKPYGQRMPTHHRVGGPRKHS